MAINPEDHMARMELYKQGLSDYEIGNRLYLTPQAVMAWRRKYGLKTNFPRKRVDYAFVDKLLGSGLSIPDVAQAARCSVSAVEARRRWLRNPTEGYNTK